MDELKFSSLNELYNRLLPALKTRCTEFSAHGLSFSMPEDIWNFLKTTKWKVTPNLTLAGMVDDILTCDKYDIENYIKSKMKHIKRGLDPDEEEDIL